MTRIFIAPRSTAPAGGSSPFPSSMFRQDNAGDYVPPAPPYSPKPENNAFANANLASTEALLRGTSPDPSKVPSPSSGAFSMPQPGTASSSQFPSYPPPAGPPPPVSPFAGAYTPSPVANPPPGQPMPLSNEQMNVTLQTLQNLHMPEAEIEAIRHRMEGAGATSGASASGSSGAPLPMDPPPSYGKS